LSNNTNHEKTRSEATADIKEAQDVPEFSRAQLRTFNSKYVDGLDEALAVLDKTNRIPLGDTEEENRR
jgi:hypothetical protein